MGDRLSVEGAGAQYPAPDKVFQAFRELRRNPATETGSITIFDRTAKPICLLGSLGRIHSHGSERTRDRGFAGVHLAILSLPASDVCVIGHSLFRIAGGQLLLPRGPPGSSQREPSLVATTEYLDPSHHQYLCIVDGVRSPGSCRTDDADRFRDRIWSRHARLGNRVRHRRQGSGEGIPGEKTRYGEKRGE